MSNFRILKKVLEKRKKNKGEHNFFMLFHFVSIRKKKWKKIKIKNDLGIFSVTI